MEERKSLSSFEGCNTASNSNVSSTSRLYASGSNLSTTLGNNKEAYNEEESRLKREEGRYRFCDAGLSLPEQVHMTDNTPGEVCVLRRLWARDVWWNIAGFWWPSCRGFSCSLGINSYLDVTISPHARQRGTYQRRRRSCRLRHTARNNHSETFREDEDGLSAGSNCIPCDNTEVWWWLGDVDQSLRRMRILFPPFFVRPGFLIRNLFCIKFLQWRKRWSLINYSIWKVWIWINYACFFSVHISQNPSPYNRTNEKTKQVT